MNFDKNGLLTVYDASEGLDFRKQSLAIPLLTFLGTYMLAKETYDDYIEPLDEELEHY